MAKPNRVPDSDARSGIDLTASLDDQLLVERVRAGDPLAFEAIFRRYHQELCGVAERVVGARVAAEDVVQDVFLAVWKLRDHLRAGSLQAYLRRATRNMALRHASRAGVRRVESLDELEPAAVAARGDRLVDVAPSAQEDVEAAALAQEAEQIVATLPPRMREVYQLRRDSGLSNREIAERLQISQKTVEVHLTRAFALLRSALAKWRTD